MKEPEKPTQRKTSSPDETWIDPLQPMAPKQSWFGRKPSSGSSMHAASADPVAVVPDGKSREPSSQATPSGVPELPDDAKKTGAQDRRGVAGLSAVEVSKSPVKKLERDLLPGELARLASSPKAQFQTPAAKSQDHELTEDDFVDDENDSFHRAQELAAKKRAEEEKHFRSRHWAIWLFFMTCVTTFLAGLNSGGGPGPVMPEDLLRDGLTYAGCVMAILCAHELGHYLQSKRHGLPFYYPYFIPFPFGIFGTLGATVSSSKVKLSRSALLDIATTGPLFGLIVTLPIALYGAATSIPFPMNAQPGFSLSDPPILRWMIVLTHPQLRPNDDVLINPALLAGWFGIYWTALNLVPIGQLDGGQIMTALIGRRAEVVSKLTIVVAVVWMLYSLDLTFSTMLGLMAFMGIRSAEIDDESVAPSRLRMALGWLLLAFLLIGFTPIPFRMA